MAFLEKVLSTAFLVPMGDPEKDDCRWGLNVMLWGEPGIGKSDRVEAAAASIGLPCRTVLAPTCQPEDVGGAAFPNKGAGMAALESVLDMLVNQTNNVFLGSLRGKGGVMALVEPAARAAYQAMKKYGPGRSFLEPLLPGVNLLIEDQAGVLFLDELSSTKPTVQAAMLGVVLQKRLGGVTLPPQVRVIAAGNPVDSAAGGWDLEPPMANRFCHIDVKVPTENEWIDYLFDRQEETTDILDGMQKVRENWKSSWARAKSLVAGFKKSVSVKKGSTHFHIPEEGDKNRGKAWPSPRTWVFATRAFATCLALGMEDKVRDTLLTGCIGEESAGMFLTWLASADLPTSEEALRSGWRADKGRADKAWVVYTSMGEFVMNNTNEKKKAELLPLLWKRFEEAITDGFTDIVIPVSKSLVLKNMHLKDGQILAEAKPVMVHIGKSGAIKYMDKK